MTHTLPQILDILSWAFTALAFLLAFAVHHHVPLLLFPQRNIDGLQIS